MKQIIFSLIFLSGTLIGKAQNHLSGQQGRYEASTWTFTKSSLSDDATISSQRALVNIPDSITMRVLRNTKGQVVKTLRYYTAVDVLPLHIQARLIRKFSDYVPTAIIEEYDVTGIEYIINVSKGNQWIQVHVSSKGRVNILGRYHNSLLREASEGYTSTLPLNSPIR